MIRLLFFYFTFLGWLAFGRTAVTYDFSGGRFGDNLLSYIHAKWIAYVYDIPLLYRPFPLSSELNLHKTELRYEKEYKKYKHHIHLDITNPISFSKSSSLLICPYFPQSPFEIKKSKDPIFSVDWKNPEFRCLISQRIAPRKSLHTVRPYQNYVGIALHFRQGGNFDGPESQWIQPFKFPPPSFYITCLKHLLALFNDANIHCHVFTDANKPDQLIRELQDGCLMNSRIIFTYLSDPQQENKKVLEDFFSLFNFDILIRPDSNFSIIPSLLHDYAVVLSPFEYEVNNQKAIISQIKVEIHSPTYHQLCDRLRLSMKSLSPAQYLISSNSQD